MESRTRKAVSALLLSLLAATAGCSSDAVTFHGGDVPEAEQFLVDVESTWTKDLARARVNEHSEARCYFATVEDSSDVETTAYCGPVRHYVDPAADAGRGAGPGLWDSYTFGQQAVEGGFAFDQPELAKLGVELPSGASLARPDGSEPPSDASDLAAPPPPAAKPGLITSVDDVELENPTKPADGEIAGPRYSLLVEEVGTAETIVTDAGTRAPAEGERFVVARLRTEAGFWSAEYDDDDFGESDVFIDDELLEASPSYAVQVDSRRTRLPDGTIGNDLALVVSVPEAASKVELVVTVAGQDQTFSLTSGKLMTDPVVFGKAGISRQYPTETYDQGTLSVSHSQLFTDAYLSSYHPTKGWADDGKAWLVLATEQSETEFSPYYTLRTDPRRTAVAKTESGSYRNSALPVDGEFSEFHEWRHPLFVVDATERRFDVTYEPTYFFSSDNSASSPQSGTARMEPQEFEVVFE